jgi:hypothetical protein
MLLELTVPAEVPTGHSVPILLRLTNASNAAQDLALQGRPSAYDVIVTRRDGAIVWRRLEGEVIQSILRLQTLAPGESLEFRHSWNQRDNSGQRVPPGEYFVTGVLPTDPPAEVRTQAVALRILP